MGYLNLICLVSEQNTDYLALKYTALIPGKRLWDFQNSNDVKIMLQGEKYEELKKLDDHKKKIEKEIDGLVELLTSEGMPGISGSLVDAEGFPRQDVDLYLVRNARHRLACLKTDYKEICELVEKRLHELHAACQISAPSNTPRKQSSNQKKKQKAFSYIDEIAKGSAADLAGLRAGDHIIQLGCVFLSIENDNVSDSPVSSSHAEICSSVRDCFRILSNNGYFVANVPFDIKIIRNNEMLTLTMTLAENQKLGCHLVPLHNNSEI